MKIEMLTMQGFGSYASLQKLDFKKQLASNQMFVISGKTGAGKTMIFDAIHFALYGEASGADRPERTLRSDFIAPGVKPFVELTFSVRNESYTVSRSLAYEKEKTRGTGFTSEGSKVRLQMPDGTIFTKISEVNHEIEQILGFNAQQFKQLVMIPQGEFKKLLLAKNQERTQIFQKIFGTSLYEWVQNTCKEETSALYAQIVQKQNDRYIQLQQFQFEQMDEETKGLMAREQPNLVMLFQRFADEIQIENEKLALLQDKIEKNQAALAQFNQRYSTAKSNYARFSQLQAYEEKQKVLANEKPVWEEKKQQLLRAKRANKVYIYFQVWKDTKEKFTQLSTMKEVEEKNLSQAEENLQQAMNECTAQEKALAHKVILQKKKEQVAKRKENAILFERERKKSEVYQEEIAQLQQIFDNQQDEIYKLEEELQILAKQMAYMQEVKERLADLKVKKLETKKVFEWEMALKEKVGQYANKKTLHEKGQQNAKLVEQSYLEKKQKHDALQLQYEKNIAGILATSIKKGDCCPVCGSTEHPNLAKPEGDMIEKKAVDDAKVHYEQSYQEWQEALQVLRLLFSEMNHLEDEMLLLCEKLHITFDGNITDTIEKRYLQSKQQLSMYEDEEKESIQILLQETELGTQHENHRQQLNAVKQRQQEIIQEQAARKGELKSVEAFCNELYEKYPNICTPIAQLEAEEASIQLEIEQLDKNYANVQKNYIALKGAFEKQTGICENLEKQIHELQQEIKQSEIIYLDIRKREGFTDEETFLFAYLSDIAFEQLEQSIQQFEKEWETISTLYTALKEELKDVQLESLESIEQEIEKVTQIQQVYHQEQKKLYAMCQQNTAILQTCEKITKEIEKEEKAYGKIAQLSQVLNGKNAQNLSFERYVLGAYFEQIIDAANLRLQKMTQKRFELQRKLEIGDRRKSQGLDLAVFDSYTGKLRDVSTLSGGESFKAALAMALGLADVVQASSGGIQMDTIFIDEGFGSLDAEALETAIECLYDLQNEGRIVGMISHIEELKRHMPIRLEVIQNVDGSHARFRNDYVIEE